jgi:23S rRNA pseudouridine2605 synthase
MVADRPERLFHVGRLDAETEGLLLLTNDGELTNRLLHPSHEVAKTYRARVDGAISKQAMRALGSGIDLDDGPIACDSARVIQRLDDRSLVEVTLHSGKNRIVRRMFDAVGYPVLDLVGQPQAWPGGRGSWRSTAIPLHGRRAVTGSTRFPRDRYPRDP